MEIGEGRPTGEFIEIEGPEYLNPDQNILDQAPFGEVCQEISSRCSISIEASRSTLNSVVLDKSDIFSVYAKTPTQGFREKSKAEQEELIDKLTKRLIAFSPLNRKEFSKANARKSAIVILRGLLDFPYWGEYLGMFVNAGGYNQDGSLRREIKSNGQGEISYAKWVTDKLRSERNAVLFGIDEVFPKTPESISTNRTTRRWRILKASELVRSR